MVDYAIDSDYKLIRTEWGDFEAVVGYDEFEDDLATVLRAEMKDLIRSTSGTTTVKEKIQLRIKRVAATFGVIEDIASVSIEEVVDGDRSFRVEVTYLTQQDAFSREF